MHSSLFTLHSSLKLLPLLALCLLASCGKKEKSFTLEGKFRDMQAGELLIYNQNGALADVDTIIVKDGSFKYVGKAESDLAAYMLVFPNAVEQVIFAREGDELRYEATANDLRNYVVNGNEENKVMNQFRKEVYKSDAKQTREAAKRYIEKNKKSLVAIYLFDRFFLQDDDVPEADIKAQLDLLIKSQPKNRLLLDVQSALKSSGKTAKGKKLPKLSFTTYSKQTYALDKIRRPYVLIAFWATWLNDAWQTKETLQHIRDEYKDSRQLDIVAFSLDTEDYRFSEFADADSLGIRYICDHRAWNSPLVSRLAIRDLPSYVIADSSRTILHYGTDIHQMQTDVEKTINE